MNFNRIFSDLDKPLSNTTNQNTQIGPEQILSQNIPFHDLPQKSNQLEKCFPALLGLDAVPLLYFCFAIFHKYRGENVFLEMRK